MDDLFLSTPTDRDRAVCVSPISAKAYKEAGGKGLGGDYGYFIYEVDLKNPQSGIEIIAKAASIEAAVKLFNIISVAFTNKSDVSILTP